MLHLKRSCVQMFPSVAEQVLNKITSEKKLAKEREKEKQRGLEEEQRKHLKRSEKIMYTRFFFFWRHSLKSVYRKQFPDLAEILKMKRSSSRADTGTIDLVELYDVLKENKSTPILNCYKEFYRGENTCVAFHLHSPGLKVLGVRPRSNQEDSSVNFPKTVRNNINSKLKNLLLVYVTFVFLSALILFSTSSVGLISIFMEQKPVCGFVSLKLN